MEHIVAAPDPVIAQLNGVYERYKAHLNRNHRAQVADQSDAGKKYWKSLCFFNHPGLNSRYGIELEFFASSDRNVIANRVNNCIFNQNADWWRKNFNALGGLNHNQLSNPIAKSISGGDSFDEYSSFFLETSDRYRGKSFTGHPGCAVPGNAGPRIERDPSVEVNDQLSGTTLWSNNSENWFKNTDLKTDEHIIKDDYKILRDLCCNHLKAPCNDKCISYTLKTNPINGHFLCFWNNGAGNRFNFKYHNELVTNVLANIPVEYPHIKHENIRHAPLGSLLMDNLVNHMLGHRTVLAVQRCGFHVHLSEYPRLEGADRVNMVIRFIKLFYLFEPLLFSFHPAYRCASDYTQSLQSLFNYNEILNYDAYVYADLLSSPAIYNIGGVDRKIRGLRYLSLNIQNLTDGGIGTIEVRLGQASYSSKFIQAYVNILQNMLELSRTLSLPEVNALLRYGQATGCLPAYCMYDTATYNRTPPDFRRKVDATNMGRPVRGFFLSNGDQGSNKSILVNLIKLFHMLTNSKNALRTLTPYINYYHARKTDWISEKNITDDIAIDGLIAEANAFLGRAAGDNFNDFKPVLLGSSYSINAGKNDVNHECRSCVKIRNQAGASVCKGDFNNGDTPASTHIERVYYDPNRKQQFKDESRYYKLSCNGYIYRQKTQTELLSNKTHREQIAPAAGGKRKITRKSYLKQTGGDKANYSPNNSTNNTNINYTDNVYKVNEGANPIIISKDKDMTKAYNVDWMGGLYPDETLSKIVNELLKRDIVNEEKLNLLVDNRYIDLYVFLTDNEIHNHHLIEELAKFDINETTINKIRTVYKEISELTTVSSMPIPNNTMTSRGSNSRNNLTQKMYRKMRNNKMRLTRRNIIHTQVPIYVY